jgi:hypothetical protein
MLLRPQCRSVSPCRLENEQWCLGHESQSGARVLTGPNADLLSSDRYEAGNPARNLCRRVQSVKNSGHGKPVRTAVGAYIAEKFRLERVEKDLDFTRMQSIRRVGRGWRPRRLRPATRRPWSGVSRLVSRLPVALLVWQCTAAGLACGRSEPKTGESEASSTPALAAETVAQGDSAFGAGGAKPQPAAEPGPGSVSGAERRSDERVVAVRSGIEGRVTIGPACPVVEENQPCPDGPYQAELTIRRSDSGDIVATVMSDAEGLFRVELPPGWYVVDPGVPRLVTEPRAESVAVEVTAGRFVQVRVRFDSGVR